ncbi:CusA/CzcA family heavy metal efflux RND transporter [Dyella sp. LX-66]|uniref:efflux RND transporter permease subunit n=1 Tax=unclassified Dyella TaxID=2634549 RepID=UPI001BDFDEA4|nr:MULTISPECIES: CusA/CzcA family heavy metal efflux RND transporter [unclassified Dyella]MBT2119667.1 CusA/CzcA family heavy metal efflux RND transporter [Dyella sp. LX-1]MBT2142094.1 CusA/CzcA family heavy metal efflux RND transporter [Dyella sp. LX-66]
MLGRLVELSLRYKLLVLILFLIVGVAGYQAVRSLPIDAFPDVTPVQVNVYTEASGLAAEDVEQLLTTPVESALAGLPKVQEIRSVSLFGLSYVSVYFEDDMDIYFARQLVNERLQQVGDRLPAGYGKPEMGPNTSGLGQVFWYTVERADKQLKNAPGDMDLRTLQDWNIRLILRTAPGVDDVTSWGGQEKQYQVRIDPMKLIAHNLGFKQVMEALEANNAQVGGNFVDVGREQYLVRGLGLVKDARDLGNIVLKTEDGTPVYVRDVASIVEAGAPRTGAVTRDGKEVVMGQALARIGENAKDVVDAVKAKLATVEQALPEGVVVKPVYERTELVNKAVGTAVRALIEGSILVAIVLFLFLGELRSALVVVIALPLAMLIAFICMEQAGLSANLMSLAGLAIGIGMMVDGAVVMVENAFRIMAERKAHGLPVDRTAAVLAAAREVANPIAFAILIIIVVFLPLFSLQGLEGKMFKPMAFNISFAMAGSLILALTLIPVLAALVLKPKEEKDTRLVAFLKRHYARVLDWSLARRRTVVVIALAALAGSLALFPFLGKEFMPNLKEGSIMWRITSIPSASLDESIAISQQVEALIKQKFPEVDTTLAMIGRAEKGETADVNYMEVYTPLKPKEQWRKGQTLESIEAAMQQELSAALPTAVVSYTQPIQMRIEELISGVRATLALKLYGDDLGELDRLSGRIKDVLAGVPGVADLALEANLGKPQIRIRVDRDALARYGLNAQDVLTVVKNGIGGEPVSTLLDGVRRFDIAVRLDEASKASLPALERVPIRSASGALVQLSQVAEVTQAEGYSFIRREQLQRYAVIQMDVRGRDIDGFVREANAAIAQKLKLPTGYYTEWGGAFENQQRALQRLSLIVPATIFFIFILLYTAFNSMKYAALILANVPFATIGGIVGLAITGQYLSVPSAIGFIAVFGVAMLNGIVLVSFLNEQRGQGLSAREAVLRGTALRLRPVLMTASVAILGLVPMLLSSGVGAETQRPLATVVVGGLITSTLLTLVLLPTLYEWLELRAERKARNG